MMLFQMTIRTDRNEPLNRFLADVPGITKMMDLMSRFSAEPTPEGITTKNQSPFDFPLFGIEVIIPVVFTPPSMLQKNRNSAENDEQGQNDHKGSHGRSVGR